MECLKIEVGNCLACGKNGGWKCGQRERDGEGWNRGKGVARELVVKGRG